MDVPSVHVDSLCLSIIFGYKQYIISHFEISDTFLSDDLEILGSDHQFMRSRSRDKLRLSHHFKLGVPVINW